MYIDKKRVKGCTTGLRRSYSIMYSPQISNYFSRIYPKVISYSFFVIINDYVKLSPKYFYIFQLRNIFSIKRPCRKTNIKRNLVIIKKFRQI